VTIEYKDDRECLDLEQLTRLRAAAGWTVRDPVVDRAKLEGQIAGARWVVSAWDGPRMVGFARAISDGVTNAYVSTVVVDGDYRKRGIGRELIVRLVSHSEAIRWVLHSRPEVAGFYARLGFEPAPDMMWFDRRER
jgi:GNAT superfamily N-acetyltransferase